MNNKFYMTDLFMLDESSLEVIEGGRDLCVHNTKVNGVVIGFCTTAGLFNPWAAGGCALYGVWQYLACD